MQKKELELEGMRARLNVLISQVNPHFLFNTLNAILAISERNHYDEVSWTIEHLAIMMRKLLDWSDDQVTVREEIEFIRMYLDIEKLRFSSRFDFSITVDPEAEEFRIPKMSVQPLVENACKHGIHKMNGYGSGESKCKEGRGFCGDPGGKYRIESYARTDAGAAAVCFPEKKRERERRRASECI